MILNIPRIAVTAGVILFAWILPLDGQQNSFAAQVRKAYGPNQYLVNGAQYYNRYFQIKGHPYFLNSDFVSGSVVINGQRFSNVQVRYDVYSQQLELEYETFSEASNSLVAVKELVDGFMYGDHRFMKLDLDGEQKFYQVIGTEQFSCNLHWNKNTYTDIHLEIFSEAECSYLIQLKGDILEVKNRKTFVRCFPKSKQKEIRRLLRQRHFVFRRERPDDIVRTMHAVSNLLNSDLSP